MKAQTIAAKTLGAGNVQIAGLQGLREMDEDTDLKRASLEGSRIVNLTDPRRLSPAPLG